MTASVKSAAGVLLDTGFLVALYDANDALHEAARQWLWQFRGQFITVDHVITEACFFLATEDNAKLLDRIADGWITIMPLGMQA
jgi:predicted nucleic acid-binding protein